MLDVAGQEIMTADKVTLRMNAVVTYRVADARKAVSTTDDVRQALYREAQLALRAIVGARELDQFLADKDAVAKELEESDLRIRSQLAKALLGLKRDADAFSQVESVEPSVAPNAQAWAIRGWLLSERGDAKGALASFAKALSMSPWDPMVACEMLPAPQLPAEPIRADLCDAARKWP